MPNVVSLDSIQNNESLKLDCVSSLDWNGIGKNNVTPYR